MSSGSPLRAILQAGTAALVSMGLVGCITREIFEHAPSAGLERDITAAAIAGHEQTVEGILVAPHFREFSADFSDPRADLRLYSAAPGTLWISRAALTSRSGVSSTVDINAVAELKKTMLKKSDIYWTGVRLFTTENTDIPAMREQEDLTLYLWVGGSAEAPANIELVFPITSRTAKDIRWPT